MAANGSGGMPAAVLGYTAASFDPIRETKVTTSLFRGSVLAAAFALFLAACSSTSVVSQWRDSGYDGASLKKILVFVATADDASRRSVEDRIASSFPKGTLGVPSYSLFPDAKEINEQNREAIAARLARQGFDGALTARLASVDRDKVYVPPQAYMAPAIGGPFGPFYGYGGYAFPSLYTAPAYSYEVRKYLIETVLYDIPRGGMLWTMTTESVSPDSRQQLITEVSGLIDGELKRQGFVAD